MSPVERIELPATADAAEAAAVIAAISRFLADHAPAPAPPAPLGGWLRAALLEGVGREQEWPTPWGDPHPWG